MICLTVYSPVLLLVNSKHPILMNREKTFKAPVSPTIRYVRCIYLGLWTALATAILQATALSMNRTVAADELQNISPLPELTAKAQRNSIPSKEKLGNVLRQSQLQHNGVEQRAVPSTTRLRNVLRQARLQQTLVKQSTLRSGATALLPEEDTQFIKSDIALINQLLPNRLVAQTDSSGVVGDTLGETNRLRQELLIDPIVIERGIIQAAPASSAGTPTGYGASWRQAYVGVGGYIPFDGGRVDGSAGLGFGLGDALKSIAAEIGINFTSIGGQNFDFGQSGGVGIKIHKYFSDGTAVAVGWSNPIKWGEVDNAKDTFYGVVTKSIYLQPKNSNNQMPLTVSVGLGTGSFRSKGAIEADTNSVNVFGSVGLRVTSNASIVSSWTGNSLNVGGSFTPLRRTPVVLNAIFTDVTNNLDQGTGLSLSAGYVFQF